MGLLYTVNFQSKMLINVTQDLESAIETNRRSEVKFKNETSNQLKRAWDLVVDAMGTKIYFKYHEKFKGEMNYKQRSFVVKSVTKSKKIHEACDLLIAIYDARVGKVG